MTASQTNLQDDTSAGSTFKAPLAGVPDPFTGTNDPFAKSLVKALLSTALFRCWHILIFFGAWSTAISVISYNVKNLSIQPTLLTVIGTVVGFVISYRTTSSFERYNEGRKLWSQIIYATRTFSRSVWFHVPDTMSLSTPEPPLSEVKARILIEKKTAINLLEAFAVAVKHYLRGEEGIYYKDLYYLVKYLPSYALPAGMPSNVDLPATGGERTPGPPASGTATGVDALGLSQLPQHQQQRPPAGLNSNTTNNSFLIPPPSQTNSSLLNRRVSLDGPRPKFTRTLSPPMEHHGLSNSEPNLPSVLEGDDEEKVMELPNGNAKTNQGGATGVGRKPSFLEPKNRPRAASNASSAQSPPTSPGLLPRHSSRRSAYHPTIRRSHTEKTSTTLLKSEEEAFLLPAYLPPKYHFFDLFPFSLLVNYLTKKGRKVKGRKAALLRARRFRHRGGQTGFSGNLPLEVSLYLSSYVAALQNRKAIDPATTNLLINSLNMLVDSLTGLERILTNPIPFSYSFHLWAVTTIYLLLLPFQIWNALKWLTIPGTVTAAFVFYGFIVAGEEIENPFGYDKNDLNLDHFTSNIICKELRALTAIPPPDPAVWAFATENDLLFAQDVERDERCEPEEWVKRGFSKMQSALVV